ncbi:SBBP repeat-containing protein [Prosthecobacter sp.]|uniref:SBBP repeat-containing protein n=1 Tax=Prosthecobacter sp. TaxID=1965333 RepID=UPI0037850BE5
MRSLCLALLATSLHAATPTFEWVAACGGAKSDKTRAVTFDREGNVFMAGEATDDGTFGDQKRTGLGSTDFFLTKVSPDGKFLWVRSLGGSLVDRGYGVATDPAGNIYVTGHYQSTDAQANGHLLPNAGDYDVFIAKYDTQGALLWIKTAGGKGYDYGHGIAVDSHGDIVVTGSVAGEAKFGDVVVNANGTSVRPIFCAKYDPSGNLKWVKATSGKFNGSGHGLGVDAKDAIYIGGNGGGEGSLDGIALQSKAQGGIVLKLTPEGTGVWAASLPGAPSAGFHEIAVDSTGRTWCAGMFKGVLNGGPVQSTGDKDNDGVLAHFSPEGKLLWSQVLQGPATDYCLGVATDNTGRCFVTGEFSETATFAGQTLKTQGATDIFTASFDEKGALEWLLPTGGAKGDNAYCMAWHPSGRLIFSGACVAPATFGEQTMTSPGGAEAYGAVLRLK